MIEDEACQGNDQGFHGRDGSVGATYCCQYQSTHGGSMASTDVSEVFHSTGGRVPGPDPRGRSCQTSASFSDPDGNGWLLQEIKTRLPGREWED